MAGTKRGEITAGVLAAQRDCPAPYGTALRHDLGISRSQVRVLPGDTRLRQVCEWLLRIAVS